MLCVLLLRLYVVAQRVLSWAVSLAARALLRAVGCPLLVLDSFVSLDRLQCYVFVCSSIVGCWRWCVGACSCLCAIFYMFGRPCGLM